MSETASSVLDETGRPIGQTENADLVDEGGQPLHAPPRPASLRDELLAWGRAYPLATLIVGALIGYALAPHRR